MNLLILGAGGQGRVVRETAEAMSCYDRIESLDDKNPDAIRRLNDYQNYRNSYDTAFVAIGDNKTRVLWQRNLEAVGYILPTLIHPIAYVSPSASIGPGTIVESLACINAGVTIGPGCIISISTVIDHDSKINDFSRIDCGAVLSPRSYVD